MGWSAESTIEVNCGRVGSARKASHGRLGSAREVPGSPKNLNLWVGRSGALRKKIMAVLALYGCS